MITAKELSRYANQSRAFAIHLADGRQINVPRGVMLFVTPKASKFIVESHDITEVFNLSMVTSIKVAKQKPR